MKKEVFSWLVVLIYIVTFSIMIWHGFEITVGDNFRFECYSLKRFF